MSSSTATAQQQQPAPPSNEIIQEAQMRKQELTVILEKMKEMELEKEEHALVIDTLKPLEKDRKCYRLVGGVLVERSVGEVLPALEGNVEGIVGMLKKLLESYQGKEKEFMEFQKKHKIRVTNSN